MEGSIEFLMPNPLPCEHCGGSGKMAIVGVDPSVASPAVVTGEADCPMCGGKGHGAEPDGDFQVRASYRIGNLMGQGGVRMIGEMQEVPEPSPAEKKLQACDDILRVFDPEGKNPELQRVMAEVRARAAD